MKTKIYQNYLWLIILSLSVTSLKTQAQIRTTSANYPGIVEFSGSQNSSTGLIYEIMPGPSVINPAMSPTPFSDSINMTTGSYSITVVDVDSVDSMTSKDSVASVNIQFIGNNGTKYKIDKINIIHKPLGAGDHTFFGGIGLNKVMHGNTMVGTDLMPKMMAYITLWGLVDLKDATTNSVIASNRIIHMMVATNVRDASLKLDTNVVSDASDYNIKNAHTHIILPPLDMAGNMSPIPGTNHGFLHMMFEKPILENSNKDWTKVYEVLPGPAVMNPAMNPTPFSDRVSIAGGSYSISVSDIDTVDSPTSLDSVISVDIKFERPNGEKFMIDNIMIIHKMEGTGDHTFFGGVGYDKLMHGNTSIGIGLMPKMKAYVTLWGIADLKDGNGNVLASNRVIHIMIASRVRRDDLSMIPSGIIDSSDYDPTRRETHIILPPQDMAGNMDPVPGTGHGFLHLMYENVALQGDGVVSVNELSTNNLHVRLYPNPFRDATTLEYRLENQSNVQINIYNSNGVLVETIVNEIQLPGIHKIEFNANSTLPSGMYVYVINVEGNLTTGKMSLMK